ncbi:hypothetical protein EDB83DRAFT_2519850 [Lactarius deliciosus]|nr:hypothetical protein EDB83DRAFT_2519850 [Lactarius deliciosus]
MNRQSLAIDFTSSFLSLDIANAISNPGDTTTTALTQQHAKLKATSNTAHCPFTATQLQQYAP